MKIINLFQMNDWEIKDFLIMIFVIQISILGLIELNNVGIEIPILQQIIGFIYLTFIPGILILRCLNIHGIGNLKTVLYSLGLSITTIMFTGFTINLLFKKIGIIHPLSLNILLIVLSLSIIILAFISYVKDRNFANPSFIDTKQISVYPIFLCLIPFLSIFGTYTMNFYNQNLLQIILIPVICLTAYITLFRNIKHELYPFSIFSLSISILFHASLISTNLWGWDINTEYYLSNLVLQNSFWSSNIFSDSNSMLSVVILAPMLSKICNINITWVFKICYPILFSFVPLGLYLIFKDQFHDEKISFLACFFFISINTFGLEMLQLARQQIGELFLILLILVLIETNIPKIKKSFFGVLFGVSLIVSHYGLSYIFSIYLISAMILMSLIKSNQFKLLNKRYNEDTNLSFTFILLFLVFTFSWYIYVSGGSIFENIVHIGNHIYGTIFVDFLNPESVQGLSLLTSSTNTPLRFMFKIINYIVQFFIVIGVISLLFFENRKIRVNTEYKIFTFVSLLLLIFSVTIPNFSNSLNTTRLFQIVSIFLAPCYVLGGISVLKGTHLLKLNFSKEIFLKILMIFTMIYFFFSSGFIYELANDQPSSHLLNNNLDGQFFTSSELSGAYWLNNNKKEQIYTDNVRSVLFNRFSLSKTIIFESDDLNIIKNNSYIYLGTWNILKGKIAVKNEKGSTLTPTYFKYDIPPSMNKIYFNGGSAIYLN